VRRAESTPKLNTQVRSRRIESHDGERGQRPQTVRSRLVIRHLPSTWPTVLTCNNYLAQQLSTLPNAQERIRGEPIQTRDTRQLMAFGTSQPISHSCFISCTQRALAVDAGSSQV
jgi:hypothetical protein